MGSGLDVTGAWDRLWTPHRMKYLRGENKPKNSDAGEDCPFCVAPMVPEKENLVVAEGALVYAVLNLYPYNSGHLMVCPYRHVADYTDLSNEEILELGQFTQQAMTALWVVSNAHGFNIGMNQGASAGAGIAGHLHQHVVPRWGGDTNFLPIIGGTKTISQLLEETRSLVSQAWEK